MKVLLTGGLGFLGSHLINKYHNEKCQFIVLDKETYAANYNKVDPSNIHMLIKGDVCDLKKVEECVEFSDAVFHWSAESMVDRSTTNTKDFMMTNVVGTANIAAACVKYNKPLIHKSTDEVLGSLPLEDNGERFTPDSPIDPKNLYAASKASGELVVRAHMLVNGLKAMIIRCCNVYGPGQHPEKLIPNTILKALKKEPIIVYPDGNQSREWLYIDDYVAAITSILCYGKYGQTYNISSDNCVKNRKVIEMILNKVNGGDKTFDNWLYNGNIHFKNLRPSHDERYHMEDFTLNQEFAWCPEVFLEDGIERTIEWYKNQ